jgi:hypothetical protein
MNCLNCGKHVESSASYCDYCGVGVVYLSSDVQSHSCQERVGPPGYMCFVLNNDIAEAPIFEATDENSQVLYKLGKYEPIPIIAENENWLEVLLPGELRGFISKVIDRKLEISHE